MRNELSEYYSFLKLKNYSLNTINSYTHYFEKFLDHFTGRNIDALTKEQILDFLYNESEKVLSAAYMNQLINSIKFYYEKVLGKKKEFYNLPRAKKPQKLPTVLSEEEISILLDQPENLKHKCVLYLIYSGGLRISEAVNMRVSDIHSMRNIIIVRGGKGKKDRTTLLSKNSFKCLEIIIGYTGRKNIFLKEKTADSIL